MFVVILTLTYPDGADEAALAKLHEDLKATRAYAGCQSVEVLRDRANPDRVLLYEHWESKEAQAAYQAWRDGVKDPAAPNAPAVTFQDLDALPEV
jgi:quinol monooxygenase YgiN